MEPLSGSVLFHCRKRDDYIPYTCNFKSETKPQRIGAETALAGPLPC